MGPSAGRPGGPALCDLSPSHPNTIEVFALDVADSEAIERAVDRVRTETGALDLLVNNAGISGGGQQDRFAGVDQETMMDVFRINAAGPHLMTKTFADLLRQSAADEPATVVSITSQLGSIANTRRDAWHSYKASKAALNMCTRLQAEALRDDNVIAVALHPGWVRTDMGGSSARLSPEESVENMIGVVANLSLDDSGRFLTHDGRELPW
ncbi:MAG: SDR family oxidoreductase [Salinibacter sp.]